MKRRAHAALVSALLSGCLAGGAQVTESSDGPACAKAPNESERGQCQLDLAVYRRKSELCAEILLPAKRDSCYSTLASISQDRDLCSTIKNRVRHDNCLFEIAAPSGDLRGLELKTDARVCAEIADSFRRDQCYAAAAKYAEDPSQVCELAGQYRQLCYRDLAASGDPALCDRVGSGPTSLARRFCYRLSFGRQGGSDLKCDNVHDPAFRQECLSRQQPYDCEQISDDGWADECWFRLGGSRPSACERVKDPALKLHCSDGRASR